MPSRSVPDEELLRALSAWKQCGRSRAKAREMVGLAKSTFDDHLTMAFKRFGRPGFWPEEEAAPPPELPEDPAVERETAQGGWAPDYDIASPLPEGLRLKGVSTYNNGSGEKLSEWVLKRLQGRDPADAVRLADPKKIVSVSTMTDQQGRVTAQWVKEKPEEAQKEALWIEFAAGLVEGLSRAAPIVAPELRNADLMAIYPIGDHHLGMLSWEQETGENYDLAIGEGLLAGAIEHLVSGAPSCDQALVAILGDFVHHDGHQAVTPTSRHQLDADGRFQKMMRTAMRSGRHLIDTALRKHAKVRVIVEIGNHDLSTAVMLCMALEAIYENEPRVSVDASPSHYHYFEFGECLIGTHHGHGAKMDQLPLIMATDQRAAWGRTRHRLWLTGHVHHAQTKSGRQAKDFSGCTVESFRILPPPDAHGAQSGYRPMQDMKALVLHRRFGEVARNTVNPEMLRSAA